MLRSERRRAHTSQAVPTLARQSRAEPGSARHDCTASHRSLMSTNELYKAAQGLIQPIGAGVIDESSSNNGVSIVIM